MCGASRTLGKPPGGVRKAFLVVLKTLRGLTLPGDFLSPVEDARSEHTHLRRDQKALPVASRSSSRCMFRTQSESNPLIQSLQIKRTPQYKQAYKGI